MNYRKTIGRLFVSILILIFPSTAFCILFWVDLDVGDSVYFEGKC